MQRRPYLLALVLAVALIAPASAGAVKLTTDQTAQYQAWADAALVPTPRVAVRLRFTGCLAVWGDQRVFWSCATDATISLAPEDHGDQAIFLHELGHVFDNERMTPRHRRLFTRWFGGGAWEPPADPRKLGMGRELFASAYSLCARFRDLPAEYETQYGWEPTQAEHDRACWLIRRAGR
jgi:hypothetical protein